LSIGAPSSTDAAKAALCAQRLLSGYGTHAQHPHQRLARHSCRGPLLQPQPGGGHRRDRPIHRLSRQASGAIRAFVARWFVAAVIGGGRQRWMVICGIPARFGALVRPSRGHPASWRRGLDTRPASPRYPSGWVERGAKRIIMRWLRDRSARDVTPAGATGLQRNQLDQLERLAVDRPMPPLIRALHPRSRGLGDPESGLTGPSIHLLPGCSAARMVDVGRAWPQKLPRPRPMTTRRGRGVRLAAYRHSEPRLLP
jgi:hypothetical protein